MDFSGRLNAFPPSELLQWAQNERRTGSMVFRRSRRQKRVYFEAGAIVGCISDDPSDYFGQHLLLGGHLTEPQLIDALAYCVRSEKRLGQVLVEKGLMTADEVRAALRQQIIDSVCSLFLWHSGVFYWEADPPISEELQPRPVDVMSVVLEGTRWIDEVGRFRQIFPHDNVVLRRGPAWPGNSLPPLEARIVDGVDGEMTLSRLHWQVKGSYFRFLEAAYGLCLSEVLDLGKVGEPAESTSLELSVYDLLLEQAVAEQNKKVSSDPLLPLASIERLRPFWVREPTEEELEKLPEELQQLAGTFDGSQPLRRLLRTKEGIDLARWDYVVEHLRKANLALLPSSPETLVTGDRKSWWRRVFEG
ncbi:MAG: DUF4388 domain-containing protein [Acidobacteria bacterium]|nr:DUF4388 domain-containing protein [Acidobacteriota bacterium]